MDPLDIFRNNTPALVIALHILVPRSELDTFPPQLSSSVSILCLCVQKWTETDTKVTFHPPTRNFFWSQMKGRVIL